MAKTQNFVKFLQQLGGEVEYIEIAELEEVKVSHIIAIISEFVTGMKEDYTEHLAKLSPEVAMILSSASCISALTYVTANKQRTRSINYLRDHVFNKVDVILTPATAITAPRIGPDDLSYGLSDAKLGADISRYVSIGNFTGIPCLSIPVGYDKQGLPIGFQIMGRWWEDHLVLRIGNAVESYMENKLRRPKVHYDILQK
ncbi:uncharacterized protein [Amphiura filiformis]|uniref:uncharacterized protein n=1 Tax=Amphiura filiformis TaxID=82378 RepID=UPI003B22041A